MTTLDALARPSGTFLMVAMDQRESLRTMLKEHGHDATDERLADFKVAVARELSPYASALLVDSEYGWFDRIASEGLVAPGCGSDHGGRLRSTRCRARSSRTRRSTTTSASPPPSNAGSSR